LLAVLREDGRAWFNRDLADMASTLQVGREAMEERLALIARSPAELKDKLALFLERRYDVPDLFCGRAAGTLSGSMPPDLAMFASDEDLQLALGA
jgi:polyketide synthase PksN